MESKDTVMDGKQIYEIGEASNWFQGCGGVPAYQIDLLKAQADISFSAGVAEGWSKAQEYYLSQGVVKKVDKEIPFHCRNCIVTPQWFEAGYIATEPLIEK